MFTTGFKLYAGLCALLLGAAVLYAWTSGGVDWGMFPGSLGPLYFAMLGALTMGWRGAIGDHLGYTVLLAGAAAAAGLGGVLVAFRDADAKAIAEVAGTAQAPAYRAPTMPGYFAPVAAFGVAVCVLGLVTNPFLIWAGLGIIALMSLEWVIQAWAERATGDYRVNQMLRNRIINPIEVPAAGALIVAFVVFGVSRVLLSVDKLASVWITIGVAGLIFIVAIALATLPRLAKPLLTGLLVLGAIAVLTGGIIGAAHGEREFEHHGSEATTESTAGAGASEAGKPASTTATTHKTGG